MTINSHHQIFLHFKAWHKILFVACLLRKDDPPYERVLENAEASIAIDDENAKAWYRKALALFRLHNTSDANSAIIRANRLSDGKGEEMAGYSVLFRSAPFSFLTLNAWSFQAFWLWMEIHFNNPLATA